MNLIEPSLVGAIILCVAGGAGALVHRGLERQAFYETASEDARVACSLQTRYADEQREAATPGPTNLQLALPRRYTYRDRHEACLMREDPRYPGIDALHADARCRKLEADQGPIEACARMRQANPRLARHHS